MRMIKPEPVQLVNEARGWALDMYTTATQEWAIAYGWENGMPKTKLQTVLSARNKNTTVYVVIENGNMQKDVLAEIKGQDGNYTIHQRQPEQHMRKPLTLNDVGKWIKENISSSSTIESVYYTTSLLKFNNFKQPSTNWERYLQSPMQIENMNTFDYKIRNGYYWVQYNWIEYGFQLTLKDNTPNEHVILKYYDGKPRQTLTANEFKNKFSNQFVIFTENEDIFDLYKNIMKPKLIF